MKIKHFKYQSLLYLLILFLTFQSKVYSQINDEELSVDNAKDSTSFALHDSTFIGLPKLGFTYSDISSFGINFQGGIPNLFRISVTFFSAEERGDFLGLGRESNFGIQLQKPITGNNYNYLYLFVGGSYTDFTGSEFLNVDYDISLDEDLKSYGAGIGANIQLFDGFAIDFEIGYGFTNTLQEQPKLIIDGFNNRTTINSQGIRYGLGIYKTFNFK